MGLDSKFNRKNSKKKLEIWVFIMLKKFNVTVQGDMTELYLFQLSIERMEVNRKKYKKEFNYFKGMRNNWFPLVLLEKMGAIESTSMTNRYQIAETFNILMGYAGFQSYYLDKYEKRGDMIRMSVRGEDAQMLEEMLRRVMCNYNLNCNYREK